MARWFKYFRKTPITQIRADIKDYKNLNLELQKEYDEFCKNKFEKVK